MKNQKSMSGKISLAIIISSVVMLLSIWLSQWQWLTYANYPLHEMAGLPWMICLFLIPVEVIAGLVFLVRERKARESRSLRRLALHGAAVLAVALCFCVSAYQMSRVSSFGFVDSIERYESGGAYYVRLNDITIEITEPEYDLIVNGGPYLYGYVRKRWMGKDYYALEYLKVDTERIAVQ